jgi:hypothetical protein
MKKSKLDEMYDLVLDMNQRLNTIEQNQLSADRPIIHTITPNSIESHVPGAVGDDFIKNNPIKDFTPFAKGVDIDFISNNFAGGITFSEDGKYVSPGFCVSFNVDGPYYAGQNAEDAADPSKDNDQDSYWMDKVGGDMPIVLGNEEGPYGVYFPLEMGPAAMDKADWLYKVIKSYNDPNGMQIMPI